MPDRHFESLIERGHVLGEVVGVDDFLIKAKGLQPIRLSALVMFDDSSKGIVRAVDSDHVTILHLGTTPVAVGSSVVMQHEELVTKVGSDLIGRVIAVNGEPLDDKGAIVPDDVWPVFKNAPRLIVRQELETQLETGVTIVDTLFPLLLGQRLAILGDSKSGKSAFLTQLAVNQQGTDRVVVYVLIAKRKADVDDLLSKLEETGALANAIVVVSTMFDSLITTYLAPYVGCAIAEYIWQEVGRDTVIIYDDLTSHAQAYREISLLSGTTPGRDSYPGDMFYAHSSLLERAGRIAANGKTLTSLPAVLVPGGDVSTYLPTNIMSITDGQVIFDLNLFRQGLKPAINTGLSVSRVGGHGHTQIHKVIASEVRRSVSKYYEAAEFAHFGTELAAEAKADLERGERLLNIMKQTVTEGHSLHAQQIMLKGVLIADTTRPLDIAELKKAADELAGNFKDDDEDGFNKAVEAAVAKAMPELKGAPTAEDSKQIEKSTPTEDKPEENKDNEKVKKDKKSTSDKKKDKNPKEKKDKKSHGFHFGKKKEEEKSEQQVVKPGDKQTEVLAELAKDEKAESQQASSSVKQEETKAPKPESTDKPEVVVSAPTENTQEQKEELVASELEQNDKEEEKSEVMDTSQPQEPTDEFSDDQATKEAKEADISIPKSIEEQIKKDAAQEDKIKAQNEAKP